MTNDLISRQDAIDATWEEPTYTDPINVLTEVRDRIKALPSAQRTGEWQITDAYPHNVYCSECHKKFAQTHWAVWEDGSLLRKYCPNCGADMRGGDTNGSD